MGLSKNICLEVHRQVLEACTVFAVNPSRSFVLVDIDYTIVDGRPHSKLTFVMRSPDYKCGVKEKILCASSKDAMKKFAAIMKALRANDNCDLGMGSSQCLDVQEM